MAKGSRVPETPQATYARIKAKCNALKAVSAGGNVGVVRIIDDLHEVFYAKALLGDPVLDAAAIALRDSVIAAIPVEERGHNIDRQFASNSSEAIDIRAKLDVVVAVT